MVEFSVKNAGPAAPSAPATMIKAVNRDRSSLPVVSFRIFVSPSVFFWFLSLKRERVKDGERKETSR
jgi:hypothetical protein